MTSLVKNTLSDRERAVLLAVIVEHLKDGRPVGSGQLVGSSGLRVSSATVRNSMAELEERGFLTHPHTSAGRIPTESGWRYYLDYMLPEVKLKSAEERYLAGEVKRARQVGLVPVKALAKALAELSQEAVLVGFGPHDVYYTGLSHLFRQPEFISLALVQKISEVIDCLDIAMAKVFHNKLPGNVSVIIGADNPFGRECGLLITRIGLPGDTDGILGILGPLRLQYAENKARLSYARYLLENN